MWQRTVWDLMTRRADEIVDTAGPAALKGRTFGGQLRDAGLALHWFRKKLREVLPHAFHDDGVTPSAHEKPASQEEYP